MDAALGPPVRRAPTDHIRPLADSELLADAGPSQLVVDLWIALPPTLLLISSSS